MLCNQEGPKVNHEFLMAKLVERIIYHQGEAIRAHNYGNYPCPQKLIWPTTQQGHVPDVTAVIYGTEFVFEVETDDTIMSDHTKSQLELFAAYAQHANAVCCLVVPKDAVTVHGPA
jgi:hypothetical protein